MALESSVSYAVYNGTGFAAVGYTIPFSYTDPDHIRVSVQAADAAEPTILTASQYDVNADPAAVYTTAAWPSTTKVIIERVVPYTQPTVWPEGGRFLAQTHEAAADRAVMQIQQVARDVAQSIRLPLASGEVPVLVPTPDALLGFDSDGGLAHYDAAYIREVAQLEGGVDTNPMATFADATARAARVPDFTGQLGLQRDDGSIWYSGSTDAGDWTRAATDAGTRRLVRTEAQFAAGVAAGGVLEIVDDLTLDSSYDLTVPVVIRAEKGKKITFSASYLFSVQASTLVEGVEFEGADRTSQRCFAIGGSRYTGNFILRDCVFTNIGCPVCADGGASSEIMPDIIVDGCTFEDIGGSGYSGGSIGDYGAIVIDWNLGLVVVNNCKFRDTYGNAIWVGHNRAFTTAVDGVDNSAKVANEESVGRIFITNNWIRDFDRNGIETFLADYSVIACNTVVGGSGSWVGGGSGISISSAGHRSVVHGNTVKEYWGYGIEITGDYVTVSDNVIDTCTHDRSNPLFGMSLGGSVACRWAKIHGNHFINIVNKTYGHAALSMSNCSHISVRGNKFTLCSVACNISATSVENVTFMENEHLFDDGSGGGGLGYFTFQANSGTKHVVINNVTRGAGGSYSTDSMYRVAASCGVYYDFTSGQQIAPGPGYLDFGDSSANLSIA